MHQKYLIRVLVTQKKVCGLDVSMHIFMLMDVFQNIKLTKQTVTLMQYPAPPSRGPVLSTKV